MHIFNELKKDRKVDCIDKADKRSYLIIESLSRNKVFADSTVSTIWSPSTVIEYVESSKPCKTLSDELNQYSRHLSSRIDIQFMKDSRHIHY